MHIKKIYIPLFVGGLVLVITVGAGIFLLSIINKGSSANNLVSNNVSQNQNNVATTQSTNTASTSGTQTTPATTVTSSYKDGTYTATGSYFAPSGDENIGVTLAIANGNISSVQISANSMDPEALRYQERFAQGVTPYVVGKTIDQAYINGRVNGSSLTPEGFNAALDLIKQQALQS